MRVLTLSWEYPPVLVGGLGRHVDALTRALAGAGHDCRVVTRGAVGAPAHETRAGVHVVRGQLDPVRIDFTTESLLAWSMAQEHALTRAALPLLRRWRPEVIHAHDWLVAQTAITLGRHLQAPIVATMHATEAGRHQGWLPEPLHRAVHSLDAWLATSATAVIACSHSTADDLRRLLAVPPERIVVVPNGVDATRLRARPSATAALRARMASDGAPVVGFAGRLVHEKGVQDLLQALPGLRRRHGAVLAVAGTGPHEGALRTLARDRRLGRTVRWLGFLDDDAMAAFYRAVDVVVVPSRYEPFGIVALEAVAAGTPVVVARTGGLGDLVEAGLTAGSFTAGDAEGLSTAVSGVLGAPTVATRAARRAQRTVRRDYAWPTVAARTVAVYERVVG